MDWNVNGENCDCSDIGDNFGGMVIFGICSFGRDYCNFKCIKYEKRVFIISDLVGLFDCFGIIYCCCIFYVYWL